MKICSADLQLLHADRQTDMAKQIGFARNFSLRMRQKSRFHKFVKVIKILQSNFKAYSFITEQNFGRNGNTDLDKQKR
jgi:hypothetical protein